MIKVTSDPKDQEVAVTFMKKNSQPPTDSLPALKETLHGLWLSLTFIMTTGRECKCNFFAAMGLLGVISDASWNEKDERHLESHSLNHNPAAAQKVQRLYESLSYRSFHRS